MNTASAYQKYLGNFPYGKHRKEAEDIIEFLEKWQKVKDDRDILSADYFRSSLPKTSPYYEEVDNFYHFLRTEILEEMKKDPPAFPIQKLETLLAAGIFTKYDLIRENLITEESWVKITMDRSALQNLGAFQGENNMPPARDVCTDIYLFGTPGTGKTCLLMGLIGTDGKGFSINMKQGAGDYAAALKEYVNLGFAPGATNSEWISTICGEAYENSKGKIVTHNFNLVEMSGEQFAFGIVKKHKVDMASMGVGASQLLSNKNRKCFFIVVDCSNEYITYKRMEEMKDKNGQVVRDQNGTVMTTPKKYMIAQSVILAQFVSLFSLPENQKIMDKVDAIHFVVTKADKLGDTQEERIREAKKLLLSKYAAPIQRLKALCQRSKRINYATNYEPYLFTFSLGDFYLGDIYEFNPNDSLRIMDCIRAFTMGVKEKTWWDRLMEAIGD